MKHLRLMMAAALAMAAALTGFGATETKDGVTYTYTVSSADKKLGYGNRKATLTFEDCGTYLKAKIDIEDANGIGLSSELIQNILKFYLFGGVRLFFSTETPQTMKIMI